MENRNNKTLGKVGEDIAAGFLEKKGYKIIERNFQNRWGEIDLICKKDNATIFIEVKTRIGEQFGLPEDAVNKNKIYRLTKNAENYMAFRGDARKLCRIDAICVVLNNKYKAEKINHYENITS